MSSVDERINAPSSPFSLSRQSLPVYRLPSLLLLLTRWKANLLASDEAVGKEAARYMRFASAAYGILMLKVINPVALTLTLPNRLFTGGRIQALGKRFLNSKYAAVCSRLPERPSCRLTGAVCCTSLMIFSLRTLGRQGVYTFMPPEMVVSQEPLSCYLPFPYTMVIAPS